MFYTAIVFSLIAACAARPPYHRGRRWNAVPTGSIMLFVAEYRNAVHSGSCLFVSRAGGHSCPAKRCDPQGWRWRVRTARRSRGRVRTRQRQVAVRRHIDSPVFVVAPQAPNGLHSLSLLPPVNSTFIRHIPLLNSVNSVNSV